MSMLSILRRVPLALATLVLTVHAGADVLVVGPGQTYTTVQSAVSAAFEGDTILVKPGTYAGAVTIQGKALTLAGDGTARPVLTGGLTIRDLPAVSKVVLAHLTVYAGLVCEDDVGRVLVADCELRGAWSESGPVGTHGARVTNSAGGVAFERTTFVGGQGYSFGYDGYPGCHGLRVSGALVALYDCTAVGGKGSWALTYADDGGDGIHLAAGALPTFLHASGSSATGGAGGDTHEDLFNYMARVGDGGDGIEVGAGTSAWELDLVCTPGPAGQWYDCYPIYYGVPGSAQEVHGSLATFNQDRLAMHAPPLVRGGSTMTFEFFGRPGDAVFLLGAAHASFAPLPSWRGVLLARPRGPALAEVVPTPFCVLDGTGYGTVTVTVPPLDPGAQARSSLLQAYRLNPNGSITLGGFLPVTAVAPGL